MLQKRYDEAEALAEVRELSRRIGSRGSRWAIGSLSQRDDYDCLADLFARRSLSIAVDRYLYLKLFC